MSGRVEGVELKQLISVAQGTWNANETSDGVADLLPNYSFNLFRFLLPQQESRFTRRHKHTHHFYYSKADLYLAACAEWSLGWVYFAL